MKKILSVAAAIFAVALLGACSSTKGTLYGVDQRKANNLPGWCGEGIGFSTKDAELYDAVVLSEKGYYACGTSDDLGSNRLTSQAASLGARTELARQIGVQMVAAEQRNSEIGKRDGYKAFDASMVNNQLVGSKIVDTYTDADTGVTYALAWISENNFRKSFASTDYGELANSVLGDWLGASDSESFE